MSTLEAAGLGLLIREGGLQWRRVAVKNRIDLSLISSAGLVGTDLCVNIMALNIRGEGGRKSRRGGDQSTSRHLEHGKARLQQSFSIGGEARRLQG